PLLGPDITRPVPCAGPGTAAVVCPKSQDVSRAGPRPCGRIGGRGDIMAKNPVPWKDRPRLEAMIIARVTTAQYDLCYRQARAERLTLTAWIRKELPDALP